MTRRLALLPAFLLLPASAWAQIAEPKIIAENDKVMVSETIAQPGESTPVAVRLGTVNVYLEGGTAEATYADGTKATVTRKAGETRIIAEKRAYSARNIGTTTIHVITIAVK